MKTEYVVDTHLHLWDLTVSDYVWLPPDGPLHTTFTAGQARSALDAAGVDTAVLVQAEDSEADTEFMFAQAARHDWIVGVVGWVRLDDPETAERQLDRWQREPAFRGVRHLVHDDPRDDFLELPGVRRSLALLADRGLPFDVPDAWPRHLARAADLAALDLFGPDRLMYGGDWPMTVPFGRYGHAWEILSTLIGELSWPERSRVLSGTAKAVYGVPECVR
jgi:L-fuconolactonase